MEILERISSEIALVKGYPYVYIDSLRALISADYHFGYEVVLAEEEGYFLPQTQFESITSEVEYILNNLDVKIFVVNGDLKHKFSRRTRQETKEVQKFTEFVSERVDSVYIVRGNHDNFVRGIFSDFPNVEFVERYLILDNYMFTHGHLLGEELLEKARGRVVLIGHEHPALLLFDDVGGKVKIPALIHAKLDFGAEVFVLPAVSPLMSGTEINLVSKEELLSPILKEHSLLDDAKPYGIVRGKYILEFPKIKLLREALSVA